MLAFDPLAPFDTVFGRSAAFLPPVDVTVGSGDLVVTMDVPGVAPDSLEVEVVDGSLLVRGERSRPELTGDATWTHAERTFGRFERRIRLPQGIDPDAITATAEHGVVSLIVPKPDRMKPRRITIGVGQERRELAGSTAT